MKKCIYCDTEYDGEPEFCRMCWWNGTPLQMNMGSVIDVLEVATGTTWYAEHTGGGCFWLCTRPDGGDRYEGMSQEPQPVIPMVIVTDAEGPLSGNDTVRRVEANGGWMVGGYPIYWSDDDCIMWTCSTEELGMKVREMQALLAGPREQLERAIRQEMA